MQKCGFESQGCFRVYHGTNKLFEHFNLDNAARPGMSGNGHLGVWLAVARDLGQRFGQYCLEVDIKVDKAYRMPLSELVRMNRDCLKETFNYDYESPEYRACEQRFYTTYREMLIEQGYDTVYLVEEDGQVDMMICLQPSHLQIHKPLLAA